MTGSCLVFAFEWSDDLHVLLQEASRCYRRACCFDGGIDIVTDFLARASALAANDAGGRLCFVEIVGLWWLLLQCIWALLLKIGGGGEHNALFLLRCNKSACSWLGVLQTGAVVAESARKKVILMPLGLAYMKRYKVICKGCRYPKHWLRDKNGAATWQETHIFCHNFGG